MSTVIATVRTRYGGSLADRAPQLRRHVVALAFWVVLPVFCLIMIARGADLLATNLSNVPAGTRGTFFVTAHNCRQEMCVTVGTFTSSDDQLVVPDQLGEYSWQVGEQHKAVYDPASTDVIPLPATWDATATALGMAGSVLFLGLWGTCLYGSLRRRSPSARPR